MDSNLARKRRVNCPLLIMKLTVNYEIVVKFSMKYYITTCIYTHQTLLLSTAILSPWTPQSYYIAQLLINPHGHHPIIKAQLFINISPWTQPYNIMSVVNLPS